jgi:hypothetical protein
MKTRDCYQCRASEQYVPTKYGGVIATKCLLHRDNAVCKRRIYTYSELMAALKTNEADFFVHCRNREVSNGWRIM